MHYMLHDMHGPVAPLKGSKNRNILASIGILPGTRYQNTGYQYGNFLWQIDFIYTKT